MTTVTVLEDRAMVTRCGTIALEKGTTRLFVRGVAPVLADRTLTARSNAGVIHDVRARRRERILAEAKPDEVRRLDEEIDAIVSNIDSLSAKGEAGGAQARRLGESSELAVRELAEDAANGQLDGKAWRETFARTSARARELETEIVALRFEIEELGASLQRKRERRSALLDAGTEIEALIELDVGASEAGEHTITLSYLVPCACWRPRHTATLSGDDNRIHFECDATVWQSTGEPWNDAEIILSTERPSLGASPPLLASDVLHVTKKNPVLFVETREQKIEEAGLDAVESAEGLPGIDDGGEVRTLGARERTSIRSDGRPHRVPLFSFETEAKAELMAMPELTACVILRTEQPNRAPHPILAGPVELVRRGGAAGRTSVLYVAAGEPFALGWGPDSALRVQRSIENLPTESTLMGAWTTITEDVEIRLSNLGGDAKRVTVKERVLVSELEKIQVSVLEKHTTGGQRPDENGFVTWTVALGPHGRTKLALRKVVKRHSDVAGSL